ncbi:MAG: KH domain-containing protein [Victivallales bacterium]|nr:KH domain-containing protein [Victivallales bacterium]
MNENVLELSKGILCEMLEKLGNDAEVTIVSDAAEPKLDLKSSQAGRLIGRKGQNLEALEMVLNRILRRKLQDEDNTPWVVLEVDGYCVPHKSVEHHGRVSKSDMETLKAMALDAAKEVKYWGEPKVVGPYRPGERRIIHMTLRNDPAVETVSDAEADANGCKRVTIRMKEKA